MKRIDLTGKVFGQWTVLSFSELRNNNSYWLCECSCGRTTSEIQRNALVYGNSTKCSLCAHDELKNNLIGITFGELTVLKKSNGNYWLCRCSCGREKIIFGGNLVSGRSKTCGHKYDDLSGKLFGRWEVISFCKISEDREAYWNCRCQCGTMKVVAAGLLKSGQSKSCGCYKKELLSERGNSYLENRKEYGGYEWYFYDNENTKIKCRSSFEVLFWNHFNFIEKELILYEPETFIINKSTRYTPDFYFPLREAWIEVKGTFSLDGERSSRQIDKINYLRNNLEVNILVFHWEDLVEVCKLPFKSCSTYFNRAKKENIDVENYLAKMMYLA